MNATQYTTRRAYHLRWMAKYMLAAIFCFAMALAGYPRNGAVVALAVGYVFALLSGRERRRAFRVLP
jgi:hypothetical protein